MAIFLRILSAILLLVAVFMGVKQGWAMASRKPAMVEFFGKWDLSGTPMLILGAATLLSAVLILWPRTFLWGNFLMAAGILFIICLHLVHRDLRGVAIELPFLLLNLALIWLKHPMAK